MRVSRAIAVGLQAAALSLLLAAEPATAQPDRFGDGTVRAGVDVPPGIYMTTEPHRGPCHITIVSGGRSTQATLPPHPAGGPEVLLHHGDQLTARGCGTWVKIG